MEAINPTEFFRNFGRTSTERKKCTEENDGAVKKRSLPEKNIQVITAPQTSPRKMKQETDPENKKERKAVSLSGGIKTKKSPKTATSASAKADTGKEDVAVLEEEEGHMQRRRKREKDHKTRQNFGVVNDSTNKTKRTNIIREKKASVSRTVQQKSSKMVIEEETLKHELREIKSPDQEVSLLFKFRCPSVKEFMNT